MLGCALALTAETATDTYTFGKKAVTSRTYLQQSDYTQYLPDGWGMLGTYQWSVQNNVGIDGAQCLVGPSFVSDPAGSAIVFYARKGTVSFNLQSYGYNPTPTLTVLKATVSGASYTCGETLAVKSTDDMALSDETFKYITVSVDEDGYIGFTIDMSTRINDITNTYEAAASTFAISGTVTDAAGTPVSGASVATTGASATTGDDGSFTVDGLLAGDYTISVTKAGYKPASVTQTISDADISGLAIVLTDDESVLAGKVTDMSDGHAVAGAVLTLTAAGAETPAATATSEADGSYSLTVSGLVADRYTLAVNCKYYTASNYEIATPWGIPQGGEKTFNPQLSAARVSFTLNVKDDAGNPLAGATVTVGDLGEAAASAPGTYMLAGLNALTLADKAYPVSVSHPDYEPLAPFDITFDGQDVTRDVTLTPIPATVIAGTVTDAADGTPVADADISLHGSAPMAIATTRSDAEGRYSFSIEGQPLEAYTVSVEARYYQPGSANVTDPVRGQTATADVALTALTYTFTATVMGIDLGGATAPLDDATVTVTADDGATIPVAADGQGRYTATVSQAAAQGREYTVTASAAGYVAPEPYKFSFDGADAAHTFTLPSDAYAGIVSAAADAAATDGPVYDMYGRRVDRGNTRTLPAGIYIRDGHKFIVR